MPAATLQSVFGQCSHSLHIIRSVFTTTVSAMLWSAMSLIPVLLMYLLLLLIVLYCWFRWSHRELLRVAADIPVTHKTWPILGHAYAAFGGIEGLTNFVLELSKVVVEKGLKTTCFWCGPLPLIVVHDSADIQAILNSSNTIDKPDEYEYFKFGFDSEAGSLTYSLLTAPGKIWRVTRKHMNPLFHPHNLLHMTPVFNQNSRELVSCLSKHISHGPVNLMPYTMDISLKTVCNLVFGPGIDIDINSPDFHGLMSVVESIPEMFIARILQPWLRIDLVYRFIYRNSLKKLNLFWNNFTYSRLEMAKEIFKRKNLQTSSLNVDDDNDTTITEPLNIVNAFNTLQKSHPEYTEADMRYEILNLYCTGTDTVGSITPSLLLALAQFPNIQERIYQELSSVVGPDDDVTLQDLNRMPYLDKVFKETLRWFLTVPYILRKATKDAKLSQALVNNNNQVISNLGLYCSFGDKGIPPRCLGLDGGWRDRGNTYGYAHINKGTCTIPAGSTFVLSLVGIHMDPKIYPDPLLFDPDRFSLKNAAGNERFTFIPFSGGPRSCIAKTYAMQLTKIMVVHVLRNFKLKTDMDIYKLRKKLVVTLVSVDGYNVHLEQRC